MERTTLADQIEPIMKDTALVPVRDGYVELHEPNVMKVVVAGVPEGARVINMRKIGSLSGIRDGMWKRICDYLVIWRTGDRDEAVFVELKKTLSDPRGREQLRRSLPYLDYLRSLCRIEYGPGVSPAWLPTRYVLIGKRTSGHLAKQRVSRGHSLPNASHEGITIRQLVGSRLQFAWLEGD